MMTDSRLHVRIGTIASVLFAILASGAPANGQSRENELIVKLFPGLTPTVEGVAADTLATVEGGTIFLLRPTGEPPRNVKTLPRLEGEIYREDNFLVFLHRIPNDTDFAKLWGLRNVGQVIQTYTGIPGADVRAEYAWDLTTGGCCVVVGVIDTGVDYSHPDLASNMWRNPGGTGDPNCGAGTHGFNGINSTCDPMDNYGHGTHIAGTIGAGGNNHLGVTGVNWKTQIMALKFLDGASGDVADAIKTITFAVKARTAQKPADVRVLSMSWGSNTFSQALLDVIKDPSAKDILFVASAGNDGANNDTTPMYPANYATAYNVPNLIAVAGTNNRDQLHGGSNYGKTSVHLGAPGVDIYSTSPKKKYKFATGTSMAVPHVSGGAVLILSAGTLTTAQLKARILGTVDRINSLYGKTLTGGRLNLCRALGKCSDFSIAVRPPSAGVARAGGEAKYTIDIVRSGGFADAVTLSVVGQPAGTVAFDVNPVTADTAVLTLTVRPLATAHTFEFTVIGKGGQPASRTRGANATLVVH
jgi:serine protease